MKKSNFLKSHYSEITAFNILVHSNVHLDCFYLYTTTLGSTLRLASVYAQSRLILCNPTDCSLPSSCVPGIFLTRILELGCHFLLQKIFLTQGSNPSLLHWQADSLPLSHQGSLSKSLLSVNSFQSTTIQNPISQARQLRHRGGEELT